LLKGLQHAGPAETRINSPSVQLSRRDVGLERNERMSTIITFMYLDLCLVSKTTCTRTLTNKSVHNFIVFNLLAIFMKVCQKNAVKQLNTSLYYLVLLASVIA